MRGALFACLMVASAAQSLCLAGQAKAAAKVTVNTSYYPISGKSGEALIAAMDRSGPKHGFTTRAIAQTRYTMRSDATWQHADGHCRPVKPVVRLDITYIYPKVSGAPLPLRLRWTRFIKGVERHELVHGRIATEMANAASNAIRKLRFKDGASCTASRAKLKREVDAIVAAYEKKQVAFDDREHRAGGQVDSLLGALRK